MNEELVRKCQREHIKRFNTIFSALYHRIEGRDVTAEELDKHLNIIPDLIHPYNHCVYKGTCIAHIYENQYYKYIRTRV